MDRPLQHPELVSAERLFEAMRADDWSTGKPRGLVRFQRAG